MGANALDIYHAECEKAGIGITIKARDEKDAYDKLVSTVGYWQAQKRHKTSKKDWTITKED